MSVLGIGIVTYNRLDHLRSCVERVRAMTRGEYRLVVADDGSADGTRDWCAAQGVTVLGGTNRGVCWNKNRALFALQELGCDTMLLLEDDCWPAEPGWELHWKVATALFGHVSFAHPKLDRWAVGGAGTATDPFVNAKATAQCSSISARLLREVGFFDTRFKGYGVGHAEWTTRVKRSGAGFKWTTLENGRRARANLYIRGGVEDVDAPTFKDRASVARNEALFDEIRDEPVYRDPWTTEEEREAFAAELAAVGLSPAAYLRRTAPDTPAATRLGHSKPLRKALAKAFEDERSFVANSGWFDGLAAGLPVQGGMLVPALSLAAVNLLAARLRPDWRVFCAGGGPGLAWWAGRVALVEAVTIDADLPARLAALQPPGDIALSVAEAPQGFAAALGRSSGGFDVICLEPPTRPSAAAAAIRKLSTGGVLVWHERPRATAEGADPLAEAGFRELRLVAPAPGSARMEATSICYRDGNCLGI